MSYQEDPTKPSTGLWKNEEGKPAGYGGKITITEPGDYFVNLYRNDKKEPGSKQPDLNLCLKRMEKQGGVSSNGAATKPAPAPQHNGATGNSFADDDIPF